MADPIERGVNVLEENGSALAAAQRILHLRCKDRHEVQSSSAWQCAEVPPGEDFVVQSGARYPTSDVSF